MADSFSPLLNLRLQQTGGNDNTWGDLLNTDALTPIENAIAGVNGYSLSGGTLDLSASPLVGQIQSFIGALSADQIVTIPALSKRFGAFNVTSGNFSVLLKTPSGTAIQLPRGPNHYDLYCDGVNIRRSDANRVGMIEYFGGSTVPNGYLECDGSAIPRASYPDLFAAIGTTWGAGNGATTFNLPDLKSAGRFLRSRTVSVGVGALQAADIAAHSHTASATTSTSTGSSETAAGGHSHSGATGTTSDFTTGTITVPAAMNGTFTGPGGNGWAGTSSASITGGGNHAHGFSTSAVGDHTHNITSTSTSTTTVTVNNSAGVETRPINASALACIRY